MYRGSRKHVLDWVSRSTFATELSELVAPAPVALGENAIWMPRNHEDATEARLERFGLRAFSQMDSWTELEGWWLAHKSGANTPNWDIAATCAVDGVPGLVLVEAKANWPELSVAGKLLAENASPNSIENHEQIKRAIDMACEGWQALDRDVVINRDSHYQLANRLAFTWKLSTMGIPVVLMYLGFTGDTGTRDAGAPSADDADWQKAFAAYTKGIFPSRLLNRRLDVGKAPVWVVSRSRPVIESSAPANS